MDCEVDYQSTGRNVFILHDRSGKTYATYGAVFLPTDFGIIVIGLVGGAAGLLFGGGPGVVIALVLLKF